jgi:hypothetical protein
VNAAAVDELAAMAAAAIASGAVELPVVAGAALVADNCGPTGIGFTTAITVVAGVAVASGWVASVAGVESIEILSVDLPSLGFEVTDFASEGGLPMVPDFPAAGLVGAGGPESSGELFEMFAVVLWPEFPLLDDAELIDGAGASLPLALCGAGGSGEGGGELEESAGKLLSTSAENPPLICDGSGRAGFGGATG